MTRACRLAVLAGAAFCADAVPGPGLDACRCINPHTEPETEVGMAAVTQNNRVVYTSPSSGQTYTFATTWGRNCAPHDKDLAPFCHESSAPSWCEAKWCFVLESDCEGVTKMKAKWLTDVPNLYFSYATCESAAGNTQAWDTHRSYNWTTYLMHHIDNYARGAVRILEDAWKGTSAGASCTVSSSSEMCPCQEGCVLNDHWQSRADFSQVGIREGVSGTEQQKAKAVCMAQEVANTYQAVAAKEMDSDYQKVGYLYFGEANTGGYSQYPKEDMCYPGQEWVHEDGRPFDPRFRPWYAGGATGPKDVILVIDASGSMNSEDEGGTGRYLKAKAAAKLILDTLTFKDYVTIVLFDSDVGDDQVYNKGIMVPGISENIGLLKAWVDSGSTYMWASGGTNFKAAFERVWQVIRDSVAVGMYTMCQKVVMFLTDGKADFTQEDYKEVRENALKEDVYIFAYTLGDNAQKDVAKKLACQNRGVFYPVSDSQDLVSVMSRYFEYFGLGQEICSTSFVRYGHAATSSTIYGACMPMYDRTTATRQFLGVSCIDVNLLVDLHQEDVPYGWNHFLCQATDITKMCASVDLSECHRQRVRLAYDPESFCEDNDNVNVDADTACPCIDRNCQDDPDFRDHLNYFCDTWVGDDCAEDSKWATWGYTARSMQAVRDNCPRSCGLCEWKDPCPDSDSDECISPPVMEECRACIGMTTGVDIEGREMKCGRGCPADAPRNLIEPCPESPSADRALQQATAHFFGRVAAVTVVATTFF